jgi:hypothetical protein
MLGRALTLPVDLAHYSVGSVVLVTQLLAIGWTSARQLKKELGGRR